jgi:three-Cys-motif partner protein
MSKDFFDIPFSEDTQIKLELYSEYLTEWIPVFISAHKPFVKVVNIFDFFAGVGRDSNGNPGSPIIAINALMKYKELLGRSDISINIYLNDKELKYSERLKANIEGLEFDKQNIRVHFLNMDFIHAYQTLKPKMKNAANLIFLDQFGIKYVDKPMFLDLINLKTTDIIFFVSSSTFKRFSEDENVHSILGFDIEKIKKLHPTEIHRFVHKTYDSFIPNDINYCIAPFSIKKGSNIYGLIFGSGHPLGIEKFLDICWQKDRIAGEANFDIEGSKIDVNAPFMFQEMNVPKKIDLFQTNLREAILKKELISDREVFAYMLNNGFTSEHIKPVIQKLKDENKITLKNPSFKASTVWKKNRSPSPIILI